MVVKTGGMGICNTGGLFVDFICRERSISVWEQDLCTYGLLPSVCSFCQRVLPAHYGRNLDALHDVLGEESEDMRLMLLGEPASEEMAAYLPRLVRVMEDGAQGNVSFERI